MHSHLNHQLSSPIVVDGFRDALTEEQDDDNSVESSSNRRLADLFKPPVDITFKGSFEMVATI